MSLRAEYTHTVRYAPGSGWQVDVRHQGHSVGWVIVSSQDGVEPAASRLINEHMEKVTRILEGGPIDPDKAEEADRLAHRGDQQQQEDQDHE